MNQRIDALDRGRRLPTAAVVSVTGLVLTAGGMLLQMAAGSSLYPSIAGPVALLVAAGFVALGPTRWARYVALLVPLLLGIGAVIAGLMNGDFIEQLTDTGNPGIIVGSMLHVVGLTVAVAGGLRLTQERRGVAGG